MKVPYFTQKDMDEETKKLVCTVHKVNVLVIVSRSNWMLSISCERDPWSRTQSYLSTHYFNKCFLFVWRNPMICSLFSPFGDEDMGNPRFLVEMEQEEEEG